MGVFFSKDKYNKHIQPLIKLGNVKEGESSEVDFESFVYSLLKRNGDKKNILLTSCFLENLNRKDASIIKEIFESSGFTFKFTLIIENLLSLLMKDFMNSFYQIPLNFRFTKAEAFFQNFFKTKIKNFINGAEILTEVFGKENISFLYYEKALEKDFFNLLCEKIGINFPIGNIFQPTSDQINPLFMDYLKSKINSEQNENINLKKEIFLIKEVSDKYKLKATPTLKDLSPESIDILEALNEKIDSLISSEEKSVTKFLSIKSESCNRRHLIPYVEGM